MDTIHAVARHKGGPFPGWDAVPEFTASVVSDHGVLDWIHDRCPPQRQWQIAICLDAIQCERESTPPGLRYQPGDYSLALLAAMGKTGAVGD